MPPGNTERYAAKVIVVIGSPFGWLRGDEVVPTGMPARISLAAAAAGARVQMVGRTSDDPTADGLMLGLARGGVGHVALLRDPASPVPLVEEPSGGDSELMEESVTAPPPAPPWMPALDATDVDLGLRYLANYDVVVLAEPTGPGVVGVVAGAVSWSGAQLLIVVDHGAEPPTGLPQDAIVFEAPPEDPDGDFAALVGRFAAALDEGAGVEDAFRSSLTEKGWTETVVD